MKRSTKLRCFGAAVIIFNMVIAGRYHVQGIPLLLMTFGFAFAFEFFVIRSVDQVPTGEVREPAPETSNNAKVDSTGSPLVQNEGRSHQEEMDALGVTFDGQKYRYQTYTYENAEDALNYARIDQDRKFRWK